MQWHLRTLIGEWESLNGKTLSYRSLSERTKLSKTALQRIGTNAATRADIHTIETLLDFFEKELNRDLIVDDLLKRG